MVFLKMDKRTVEVCIYIKENSFVFKGKFFEGKILDWYCAFNPKGKGKRIIYKKGCEKDRAVEEYFNNREVPIEQEIVNIFIPRVFSPLNFLA